MSSQLQINGVIAPPTSQCGSGCSGSSSAGPLFDLAFRNCTENYQQIRNGDQSLSSPAAFVPLALTSTIAQIEFVAIQSSGPIKLRINGAPASALSSAIFPVAGLSGLTLDFTVDGVAVSVTFAAGDDTAADVANRINSAAALAGATWLPATVDESGQVRVSGLLTGPQGSLSAFTGTAVALLGFDSFAGGTGSGADVDVDGLFVAQFPRGALSATRLEVSGQASLEVLVAGT